MNKQHDVEGSAKPLQMAYIMESMDRDTDCIAANFNLGEILNNYNN